MDSKRIEHLLNPDALQGKHLVVVGLGSGGFPAVQSLAMCGVSRWTLFDKDTLDEVNLVKHPGLRGDLGEKKTTLAERWIMDRNPNAIVVSHDVDITTTEGESLVASAVESADAVMVCTDNQNTRLILNDICVDARTPCIWGIIWRTGIGGNVMLYDPLKGGCFRCLHTIGDNVEIERMVEDARLVSEIETDLQEKQYGRDADPKYGLSGLSIDIQLISLLMARFTLSTLLNSYITEDFLDSLGDSASTTRAETHMLSLPYDVRGPVEPQSCGETVRWWDSKSGKMFVRFPRCSNCDRDVDQRDNYCPRCGNGLIWDADEPRESDIEYSEVIRTWIPMERPTSGHMINYVSIANRRMVIDELKLLDDGNKVRTGNVKVMLHPFTMTNATIEPTDECLCGGDEIE